MKKLSAIFMGIALLVSGFMFSSCEQDDDVKEILGPNGVWCETRSFGDLIKDAAGVQQDEKEGTLYFKYVDSTKTFSIAYLPKTGSALATTFNAAVNLGNDSGKRGYYLREYVNGQKTTNDDDNDDNGSILSFITAMNQNKWEVFYSAKLKKASLPSNAEAIDFSKTSEAITDVKNKFTLNNILRAILGLSTN